MKEIGFVCFGEVNTPYERLVLMHDGAVETLKALGGNLLDAGVVIDDAKYETADAALQPLADAHPHAPYRRRVVLRGRALPLVVEGDTISLQYAPKATVPLPVPAPLVATSCA